MSASPREDRSGENALSRLVGQNFGKIKYLLQDSVSSPRVEAGDRSKL